MEISEFNNISKLADWVEYTILFEQQKISKSTFASYLMSASSDSVNSETIDSVWLELTFRQEFYGNNPPYQFVDEIIVSSINWIDFPSYMACLIFSLTGNPVRTVESGKLFEKISALALKDYLSGDVITFGHPSGITVQNICELSYENFTQELSPERKDAKLDVYGWKLFDSRNNKIIVLMQCSSGNNWRTKINECNWFAWKRYIDFALPPITSISIPKVLTTYEIREYCDGNLLFDRCRIYRFGQLINNNKELSKETFDWCIKRIEEIEQQ